MLELSKDKNNCTIGTKLSKAISTSSYLNYVSMNNFVNSLSCHGYLLKYKKLEPSLES